MEIIDHFDRGVYLSADQPCMVMDDRSWTYREAQRATRKIASALVRDGNKSGTKVAFLSANDPAAFLCVLGSLRAHMVWVPLNPRNSVETNLWILEHFGCEVMFYSSAYDDFAAEAKKKVGALAHLICVDKETPHAPSLDKWAEGASETFDIEPADRDDLVALFTTGGTTGLPKGVVQTQTWYEHFAMSLYSVMPSKTPPRFLAAAPMTHAAGIFCFPIFSRGGTIYVLPAAKPLAIAEAIQKYKITDTLLPPTVIYAMLAEPTIRDYDYSSLRYFYYGTAPMAPDKVRESIEVFGPCVVSGWGQTEYAPCTFLRAEELVQDGKIISEKRLASCGRMFPFTKVAVMDPEGKLLGVNEVGELVVRGSALMQGYFEDPQATADAGRFGWHHTGDVGYFDEDGFFYIVDRVKDMIISGGFNIFPSEIERVLFTHPAVEDCAVVGIPDDKWGEKVHAVVQLKKGATATQAELLELCRNALSGMKTPKSLEFRDELPRSANGKTLKRAIRDEYWKGKSRMV